MMTVKGQPSPLLGEYTQARTVLFVNDGNKAVSAISDGISVIEFSDIDTDAQNDAPWITLLEKKKNKCAAKLAASTGLLER